MIQPLCTLHNVIHKIISMCMLQLFCHYLYRLNRFPFFFYQLLLTSNQDTFQVLIMALFGKDHVLSNLQLLAQLFVNHLQLGDLISLVMVIIRDELRL